MIRAQWSFDVSYNEISIEWNPINEGTNVWNYPMNEMTNVNKSEPLAKHAHTYRCVHQLNHYIQTNEWMRKEREIDDSQRFD